MKVTGFYGIWKIIATLYHDQPRFCAKIHSERTSGYPANTNSQSKSITPILLHTVGKNKKARRHNKYKVTQKGQHFFKDTLVERLLHMINRNGKQVAGFFLDSFCPVPWQTTMSLHMCQATFSSCHSKADPSKTNFPSCCHGSSKYVNRVLLCRGPCLRECTLHGRACDCVGG